MSNTAFLKDFNTLLQAALTDAQNEFESADVSQGSVHHLLAAIRSSVVWGLYKYTDWIARQQFPTTCDSDILDRHGSILNITRTSGETDSAYLQRILTRLRYPPAGGNKHDWVNWAKAISHDHTTYIEACKDAFLYEHARGDGTINLVVTSDRSTEHGGEEEPTSLLIDDIEASVEELRPVGIWDYLVIAATKKTQNIVMTVDSGCDKTQTEADLIAHIKALNVGKYLYKAQLISIAIQNGAANPSVSTPATDIVTVTIGPTTYERIWPGTISIT